jgi:hypothetical protein
MSVKFEKETIKTTTEAVASAAAAGNVAGAKGDFAHEFGAALTKGGGVGGYLAVSGVPLALRRRAVLTGFVCRSTSSSCRRTLCAPRCSPPEPSQACRSFLPRGLHTTGASRATTSPLEFPRWLFTARLLALRSAMFSSPFCRSCSAAGRASRPRSSRSLSAT